ncbi:hypothetical protein [Paenarthrobacter sp. PH39-S1]|uniref:hypothetical protein n=1 Tax=Paenarthrobacter sp. PH39-S1 TaxID=3046204 RepID=UPI0024B88889|nr:hypothetical protein [Paenarthrobacter sp. PH39-S1]MDJ0357690.1 hypothetical protein [Paenarthrobacter sp. PH39-S1]
MAFSFFALAVYLVVTAGPKFLGVDEPVDSPVGLGLTALSLLIMPLLSSPASRSRKVWTPSGEMAAVPPPHGSHDHRRHVRTGHVLRNG